MWNIYTLCFYNLRLLELWLLFLCAEIWWRVENTRIYLHFISQLKLYACTWVSLQFVPCMFENMRHIDLINLHIIYLLNCLYWLTVMYKCVCCLHFTAYYQTRVSYLKCAKWQTIVARFFHACLGSSSHYSVGKWNQHSS